MDKAGRLPEGTIRMSIQLFRLAAALSVIAAPALALPSGQESGGPIATQAAVNTAPAASAEPSPATNTSAAAALRAAVLPPKPAVATPATATSAPPSAAPIATLPAATTTASASSAAPASAGASVYGDAAAAQPTALAPGLTVKDRTGAAIGQVTSIDDDSKLGQLVTVQMGQESFRLSADRFGLWGGAATINLTQADIEAQLHPKR